MDEIPESRQSGANRQVVIVLIVLAIFAGVFIAKSIAGNAKDAGTPRNSITSIHNDAVADYQAALKTGKPVYVLFHSLSWQSCIEISAVADKVVPEYGERVVFVNAITGDASGKQLASNFTFQYIPQSFFLKSDGTTADSFTGAMSESDMRARLDALLAKQ